MKRFHIIAIAALAFSAAVVVAYDSNAGVAERAKPAIDIAADVGFYAIPHVTFAALKPVEFTPVFVSNFNRLVVFPETGNSALCEGFAAPARGPPKS